MTEKKNPQDSERRSIALNKSKFIKKLYGATPQLAYPNLLGKKGYVVVVVATHWIYNVSEM